ARLPPSPTLLPYPPLFRSRPTPGRSPLASVRVRRYGASAAPLRLVQARRYAGDEAFGPNSRTEPSTRIGRGRRACFAIFRSKGRSEEHTSELQSRENLVCR